MITIQQIEALHHKYAPNDLVYRLVYGHCQVVAEIAQWSAANVKRTEGVEIDNELLHAAALLHDIGAYVFFDPEGRIENNRLYPLHAILSAKIIADEGIDSRIADIVQTHLLLGISKQEVFDRPWQLPAHDYRPQRIEGQLLCYADRFHSKRPIFNAYDTFLSLLQSKLPIQAALFQEWAQRFGIPDVPALAAKYNQPIK
jgi:uncharacterized protein